MDKKKIQGPDRQPKHQFKLNDAVFMRNYSQTAKDNWIPGAIKVNGPVTYQVSDPDGFQQHRHVDQLIR